METPCSDWQLEHLAVTVTVTGTVTVIVRSWVTGAGGHRDGDRAGRGRRRTRGRPGPAFTARQPASRHGVARRVAGGPQRPCHSLAVSAWHWQARILPGWQAREPL